MTPSELKHQYEQANPSGHFFERGSMRFFGDTMRNYGVCDAGKHWQLFRKRPVKHGLHGSRYFRKGDYGLVVGTPDDC